VYVQFFILGLYVFPATIEIGPLSFILASRMYLSVCYIMLTVAKIM